jgi:hypothetical protein
LFEPSPKFKLSFVGVRHVRKRRRRCALPAQSKTLARLSNVFCFEKRLECGAFTAAFPAYFTAIIL